MMSTRSTLPIGCHLRSAAVAYTQDLENGGPGTSENSERSKKLLQLKSVRFSAQN